ncbi:PREDICTED: cytochrome P450 4d2-like [Nicrophorus vespilloides]|uniref:Cytochrome P450 4d2-like n=1 Tax=Nicrophorus vespilloides TaxID=110193 RepID=A0ABM1NGB3_NICVS|nr:PREDICTED: cytochrome P450 4d2-like [Nicrophorus vespilloides]XP_017785863.1 PREDICTED: cytochrome P450 4d2-like [Nicrophorus vespilloides]
MLWMFATSALAGILLLVTILWTGRFLYFYRHLRTIESPVPLWPIVGNAPYFKGGPTEILRLVMGLLRGYNLKSFRMTIGFKCVYLTTEYDLIKSVLTSHDTLHKSDGYKFLRSWLGHGLLIAEGERWRKNRKMLTPTFHFQILEQFTDVYQSMGDILVSRLRNEVGAPDVEISKLLSLYTLDVICETAMGCSVNAQSEVHNEYVKCVEMMCGLIQERSFNPFFQLDFIYRKSQLYQRELKALKTLHGFTESVIRTRREELLARSSCEQQNFEGKRKLALLDLLLEATVDGQPLSDTMIREEVDTFMFAGHDTTSAALSFVVHMLATHQDAQDKAYEEQVSIFGDDVDGMSTLKIINEMKYLELVIKESLRLYPSVPLYLRKLQKGFNHNGIHIPKGTTLGLFAYGIQRDPDYFPDPDKFDPQRFAAGNDEKHKQFPYCYVPFSAGPRNCIGQKFAMAEMKSTLSKILRNFKILPTVPAHDVQLCANTILTSKNGVRVRLAERRN